MTEQPKLSAERKQEILEALTDALKDPKSAIYTTLTGTKNTDIKTGNSIIQKSRVISGAYNRTYGLLQMLADLGVSTEKYTTMLANNTIGFSPEIPEHGMRGELIELVRPQKERITPMETQGLLKRNNPQPQQPNEGATNEG